MSRFVFTLLFVVCFFLSGKIEASSRTPSPERIAELEKLAKAGDATAQSALGYFGYLGTVGINSSDTLKWLYWSAEQGNAEAQFYLGLNYISGKDVEQSYLQAYFWLRLAATSCPSCAPDKHLIYSARLSEVKQHLTDVQLTYMEERVNEWKPLPSSIQVFENEGYAGRCGR